MRIKNSKSWVNYSFSHSVLGSAMLLLVAFTARMVLQPYIEPYAPYHFFIVACLLISYFYGYKLALVAVLISSLMGDYFFIQPYADFGTIALSDVIEFLTFSSVAVVATFFIERLQRTVYARNTVLKIMKSRQTIALQRENDRLYFSKKQNQPWAILEELLTDFDQILFLKYGQANVRLEPLFLQLANSPKHVLVADEWLALIHPEDTPTLLAALETGGLKVAPTIKLRFTQDLLETQHTVRVESYAFMNKTLKIVRLAKDAVDA
jgi:K+-sensing histidine kinase KdpD